MTNAVSPTELLASMTLAEKIGQMTQVEKNSITPDDVAAYAIGSVLSGGGGNPEPNTPQKWREMVESFVDASRRSRLGIPILYGTDAVHGHNNVKGATMFPHNVGLGATGDADLVRRVSRAAALETAATGARWSFDPCLAVPTDLRWGRAYESFSQDVTVVSELGAAAIAGWHGEDLKGEGSQTAVLACAKHYVGDGAAMWGTAGELRAPWLDWWDGWGDGWQIDQGDARITEAELRSHHLPPFQAAIDAGARTVMACYCAWNGDRLHSHQYLLTDVLKGEFGFDGFVVTDWMAIDQIDADFPTAVERCINAGIDMAMVPYDYKRFITTMTKLVSDGRIAIERIDDAVGRILTVKAELGLLDGTETESVPVDVIGCDAHRALAGETVRRSAVLYKNEGGALPLAADQTVLVAGEAIADIGIACGGWTVKWEGGVGPITDGSTTLEGLRRALGSERIAYSPDGSFASFRAPIGVVSIHEEPYVEGSGDRASLQLPDDQADLVRSMRERVDTLVLLVYSGRPILFDAVAALCDAVVLCWLPGSEADALGEVLSGDVPFTGQLPIIWA